MMKLWLLIVFANCIMVASRVVNPSSVGKRIPSFAGPFRAVVERFERCDLDGVSISILAPKAFTEVLLINVTRVTRPRGADDVQRVTGDITSHVHIDYPMTTVLNVSQWSSNGWKSNAFVMKFTGLCPALKRLGLNGVIGLGQGCVQKGVHSFTNLPADWRLASIPVFPYGKWRAEATFYDREGPLGCIRCLFQTSPAVSAVP